MTAETHYGTDTPARYPLRMRILHWTRAALIIGLIAAGWAMTNLEAYPLYPLHKEFGVLAFIIAGLAIAVRSRSRKPAHPAGLHRWEDVLSIIVHRAMLALTVIVPLMGYSMSSSYTQSDGVPFFGLELPELLAKNDRAFEWFSLLHRWLAYTLLALIVLHVAGVIKHRLFDKGRETDVLPRML
jgi:cytochrome b561